MKHAPTAPPRDEPFERLLGFVVKRFLAGVLVVVPMAITIGVLTAAFLWLDDLIDLDRWLGIHVPGLGILVGLIAILAVGMLASSLATRRLVRYSERFFTRLPLVKLLYTSVKDVLSALVGDERRFAKPVLVSLGAGIEAEALGFLTREGLEGLGIADRVAVYFPQSYNVSGYVLVVPRERVRVLDVESSRVMTFLVSGGISGGAPAAGAAAQG